MTAELRRDFFPALWRGSLLASTFGAASFPGGSSIRGLDVKTAFHVGEGMPADPHAVTPILAE